MLYLAYISFGVIYDSSTTRVMEFFNESFFMVTAYHMMLYVSPWLLSKRDSLGWSLICIIVLIIVANYLVIFAITIGVLR